MADLVRLAKEKPMGIDFASSGVGGMQHLGGELLNQMAGIQLAHVPYKGGPPGFADVIGGRVPSMLSGIQGALPQVKSGKVIAAAVTDTKRSKALPDVPTVAEALNLPGYEVMNWQALFFPAGTPKDRVERISSEVRKILSMPESREKLEALGYEPIGNTPDEAKSMPMGFSLASRTRSAMFLPSNEGLRTHTLGDFASCVTGSKSLSASSVTAEFTMGAVIVSMAPSSRVYPSAGARFTSSAPSTPAAPGRFSTTTACPRLALSLSAMKRPMVSEPPPAACGTMSCMGFSG
jgi:hypothetical protein